MTINVPEHLQHWQHTDTFTPDELKAITDYETRIEGIPDTLDSPSADVYHISAKEVGADVVLDTIQEELGVLAEWREHIGDLGADFRDLVRDRGTMSVAAGQYYGSELARWHNAREELQYAILEYFVGVDEYGDPFAPANRVEHFRSMDGLIWINA